MTLASYTQTGGVMWDCAIGGLPFLYAPTSAEPYVRVTKGALKDQLNTTGESGETALQNWWYRSQSSFHQGAGVKFFDGEPSLKNRFADSSGVDVWTPGEVRPLHTTELRSSAVSCTRLVSYANSGEQGVMFGVGSTLFRNYDSGGSTSFNTQVLDSTITGVASTGESWLASTNTAVYRGALPSSTGTVQYNLPASTSRSLIGWAKQRLIVAADHRLYNVAGAEGSAVTLTTSATYTTAADPVYTSPLTGWRWSGIAEGPEGIYVSGYTGDRSGVFIMQLDPDTLQYSPAREVAVLPKGEVAYSIVSYLGTYLVIGTNLGVRVCLIRDGGAISTGPLSIRTDAAVTGLEAYDRFVYATGSSGAYGAEPGIYRLDLSQQLSDDSGSGTGLFAWARDVVTATGATPVSVAMYGQTGRVAVGSTAGLYVETSNQYRTGWLETAKLRFSTWEGKIFAFLRVLNGIDKTGTLDVKWRDEGGTLSAALASWATGTFGQSVMDGADGEPHMFVSYKFTITPTAGGTNPAMVGYQVRAAPSGVKQRLIQLPLQVFYREQPAGGPAVVRPVFERIEALEALDTAGKVVRFQDFTNGEDVLVVIESLQFTQSVPPSTRLGRAERGGVLLATLRVVG